MKAKIGDILHLTFWDHSETEGGEDGRLLFETFGRLVWQDKDYYKLATWHDPRNLRSHEDSNSEFFYILKKVCTEARVLR